VKAIIQSAAKVGSRVRIGSHDLIFDQPSSVAGGEDRGPSPLDVLVVSVGACAHYFAAAYLHARGIPTTDLTVELESEKERAPAPRIGRIAITVRVPAGLSEKQIAGIELAVKRCPAYGTLVHPPSVEIAVVSNSDSSESGSRHDKRAV
jgi:uncharacterized OsmC-like protein